MELPLAAPPPSVPPGSTAARPLSVSALTRALKGVLEEVFGAVWVEGEISNFHHHGSGHMYFTLKDAESQIRAAMFRGVNQRLKFRPKDGMQVLCHGTVSMYLGRGEVQLVADRLEPQGLGALQAAFEALKEKLAKEGLFAPERKRPLPALPQRVGIVTSLDAAALRDILRVLDRRYANLSVLIRPARVQGEGAAEEIAAGLDDLNRVEPSLDLLVVTRGGGAIEDLWAFNEEVVARAIARSRLPVVSAVGHEVDFTIADFVADLRAPTPSAAAEMIVRPKADLALQVEGMRGRLAQAVRHALDLGRARLATLERGLVDPRRRIFEWAERTDDLLERLEAGWAKRVALWRTRLEALGRGLSDPRRRLREERSRLEGRWERLRAAVRSRLDLWRSSLATHAQGLEALSPLGVLARGYAIAVGSADGRILKEAGEVRPGEEVRVRLHRGELDCRVERVHPKAEDRS